MYLKQAVDRSAAIRADPERFLSWLGVGCLVVMTVLVVCFASTTFHGPDQIRDMTIARALVHDGIWPLTGPPLYGGSVLLPPAYYWLLALPLVVYDSELAVFLAFGAAFILSVGFVWYRLRAAGGAAGALIYVLLALPIFATSYTHSAWNPALTMTCSNLLLGLFIGILTRSRRRVSWILLPWVFALLIQTHPSAVPLAIGLVIYALAHPRVMGQPAIWVSLGLLTAVLVSWAVLTGLPIHLSPPHGENGVGLRAEILHWFKNLLRLTAWRDLFLLPLNAVRSIQPIDVVATWATVVQLFVFVGGAGLALMRLQDHKLSRWLGIVVAGWLICAVAFVDVGFFWYTDALLPWLAALAASGWAAFRLRHAGGKSLTVMVCSLFAAAVFSGHLSFYESWRSNGKLTMRAALLTFPALDAAGEAQLPGYSFSYLSRIHSLLADQQICALQLAGIEATVMRDFSSRGFWPECTQNSVIPSAYQSYLLTRAGDEVGFFFTQGLVPEWQIGKTRLYRPESYLPLMINGSEQARLEGEHPAPGYGFGYPPGLLPDGLRLDLFVPDSGQSVILRLGLRCNADVPIHPDQWLIDGGQRLDATAYVRRIHHTWVYHDIEWRLQPYNSSSKISVTTDATPLRCDVTAIARQ